MIVINPGSGKVSNTTEENAIENIKHFITDCNVKGVRYIRIPELDDNDGRYTFLIWKDNCCFEIQMPGLPLARVRYMNEGENPFEYPRLYVDGSSWLWCYAICDKFPQPEFD